MSKLKLLKEIFGHSDFRRGQEQAVDCLLNGRDLLAVMPTGAGKSVCYQLPALMMKGVTLVISPLISLMQDQAMALRQNGVATAFLNSSLSLGDFSMTLDLARQGAFKIIFVAPERLETEAFLNFAANTEISMIAVDEAHCISHWGQDFRPSYLRIADFISSLPKRPVIGAFTATATDRVRKDISEKLGLISPLEITTGFDRPNLYFEVISTDSRNKQSVLSALLEKYSGRSGIIYCSTRKQTKQVYGFCRESGIETAMYHAGMNGADRAANQESFIYDRARVMVATNAFGMGIDKSNVGFVIHYNIPKSPEAYYQEAGRAGRDGAAASCVLLYSPADVRTVRFFIDNMAGEGLTPQELKEAQRDERKRLDSMIGYCTATGCLREYLLDYFGEKCESCSGCSNCSSGFEEQDITDAAQRIISCVYRLEQRGQRFGAGTIRKILSGSRDSRILSAGLDTLSTYGIMQNYSGKELSAIMDSLIGNGYLSRSSDEYMLVSITEKGHSAVKNREKVIMRRRIEENSKHPAKIFASSLNDNDKELYEHLRDLRSKIAKKYGLPAYIIFSNAALESMAALKPRNEQEFLQVNGVGEAKLAMYGSEFISAINGFLEGRESSSAAAASSDGGGSGIDMELYGRLKKLRLNIANDEEISVFSIFSNEALENMARYMPLNSRDFLEIEGVGEDKLNLYGKDFIEEIGRYVSGEGFVDDSTEEMDRKLYERLRKLRLRLANLHETTPSAVLSNAGLIKLVRILPQNVKEFSKTTGIDDEKLELYGHAFIDEIKNYLTERER